MKQQRYSPLPFFLAALCDMFSRVFVGENVFFSAKEGLLGGVLAFAAVWLCLTALQSLNVQAIFSAEASPIRWLWLAVLLIGLFAAGAMTFWDLAVVYRRQFDCSTVWLILLALGMLILRPALLSMERAAHAIFALLLLAGAVLLIGLGGQMHWYSLSFAAPRVQGVSAAFFGLLCFIPEYFALPLFSRGKASGLVPGGLLIAQGSVLLCAEMVFGFENQSGRYPAMEMLRAWGIGAFSRLDALVVGLWLMLALFRLLFIESLLEQTYHLLRDRKQKGETRNEA
jgi:hypothetical protein